MSNVENRLIQDKFQKSGIPVIYLEFAAYYGGRTVLHSSPEGILVYTDNKYPFPNPEEQKVRIAHPTIERWDYFIKHIEQLPHWEGYYDGLVCDGTSWEFYYEYKNKRISCGGHMVWPEGFDRLLLALKELTGFKRWGFS